MSEEPQPPTTTEQLATTEQTVNVGDVTAVTTPQETEQATQGATWTPGQNVSETAASETTAPIPVQAPQVTVENGSQVQPQPYSAQSPQKNAKSKEVPPTTYNVFVGDLEYNTTEADLHTVFDPCGDVHQINIISDRNTGLCKGYGFVHFLSREAQMRAMQHPYNGAVIKGRPCKVKKSEQKTVLFVGNLPIEMNEPDVNQAISELTQSVTTEFRLELKKGPPPEFKSRGFCFITYHSHELADACKKILYESYLKGRQLNVSWAETNTVMREVDPGVMKKVKTLYVSSISTCVKDDMLRSLFSQFGEVVKSVIVKNPMTNESRGFAFVEYAERPPAVAAMKCLNDQLFCGQKLHIVLAKPQPAETEKKRRGFRGGTTTRGQGGYSRGGSSSARGGGMRGGYNQVRGWGQQGQRGGWNQQQWAQQGYPQRGYGQQAGAYAAPTAAYGQQGAYAQPAAYGAPGAYAQQVAPTAAAYGYGQQAAAYGAQQNYQQYYQQQPPQQSYGYQ
eukprot:CAMPEP_0168523668 /NCGR_PEP_ID=MMETSP0405-20121227/10134_1 /TAXON_ID=498012 /ORGANISM="Trichosphaerium sp, Strain Am-I-7 wt" /LENGTH=504 /DNA_ID=CAMNT_0008545613 /DNA_START=44 /DNA_END=1558 /DNA_ORIENTATION=-